jgi:hypothetical protein
MAAPLSVAFVGWSNETFSVAQPFPWAIGQWPLPAGSYFLCEARTAPGAAIAMRFDSRDGSIGVGWDAVNTQVDLTFFQDIGAMAPLVGAYAFDVTLTRPQGAWPPRVDVIGVGIITINQGVTR